MSSTLLVKHWLMADLRRLHELKQKLESKVSIFLIRGRRVVELKAHVVVDELIMALKSSIASSVQRI